MMIKVKYLFFLLSILVSGCRFGTNHSTLQKLDIEVDGEKREYILYIPAGLPSHPPLVVAIHGFTDNDSSFMNYTGLNRVADKNGFAVCYPQGTRDSAGNTFWQVGYSFHRNERVNDVRFLTLLTKHLQFKYGFNPDKTFATGMSNGGDMCILLACKEPELFKAIAPVVGCMMMINIDSCSSALPIPVFMINGTNDKITWWDGDLNNTEGWGAYLPVRTTIDFFADKNMCIKYVTDTLPDINKADSSYVISKKFMGGTRGNQVWLYTVVNGGHDWAGKSGNMDINASEEIWNFLKLTGTDLNKSN